MDREKKKLISIVGDAFADIFCYLDENTANVVVGGDARLSQPITIMPGGSGLNTSTHLRSLINHFGIDDTGFEVHFQTVINENDQYGTLLASHAKKIGINLLNRRVSHFPSCFLGTEESLIQNDGIKSTGHCAVIVSKGERSFMTYLGCLEDFRGSHIIDESVNHSYDLQHVHVSGYFNIPGFWNGELKNKLAEIKQRDKRITVSLVPQHDATKNWDGGLTATLEHVDVLILSETEAKGITKYHDSAVTSFFEYAACFFRDTSPNTHIIVTLGSDGCVYIHNGVMENVATIKKEPVDPTGAGDAYAAGFIWGFLSHMAHKKDQINGTITSDALKTSMLWGCATGSSSIMIRGASVPQEKHIISRMLEDIRRINAV